MSWMTELGVPDWGQGGGGNRNRERLELMGGKPRQEGNPRFLDLKET